MIKLHDCYFLMNFLVIWLPFAHIQELKLGKFKITLSDFFIHCRYRLTVLSYTFQFPAECKKQG